MKKKNLFPNSNKFYFIVSIVVTYVYDENHNVNLNMKNTTLFGSKKNVSRHIWGEHKLQPES